MMKSWGTRQVSSAFEVYQLLNNPPEDAEAHWLWTEMLEIEPPIWGSKPSEIATHRFIQLGFHVWSWDDHGVVLSTSHKYPPEDVVYRPWHVDASGGGR